MMTDIPATTAAQTPPPRPHVTAGDAAATAQSFEAVFIGQMTRILMDTAPADGPFSGGHGEEMFRGILAEKLGDTMAKRGGLGLAPAVLKHIIHLQEGNR